MEPKDRRRPTFPLSSIIGNVGLTAVFGMGTGVSQRLWSPEDQVIRVNGSPAMNREKMEA